MSYSEEDTFQALQRRPFREVYVMAVKDLQLGERIGGKEAHLLRRMGWTESDFESRLLKELLAGTVTADISLIRNKEYLEEVLKNPRLV